MGKAKHQNVEKSQPKSQPKQQPKNIQIPSHTNTFKRIVWFINFIFTNLITYYMINKVCNNQYQPVFLYYAALPHQTIQSFGISIAVLLLMYGLSADWLDIFGKTENDLYRSHRNVINNTILWGIIYFVSLIIYRQNYGDKSNRKFEIALTDLFLVGRLVFSIGYTIGTLIGHQSFRSYGFGLTIAPVLVVLGEITGYSIIQYLK